MNRCFRSIACGAVLVVATMVQPAVAGTLVAFNFGSLGTVNIDLFDDLTPLSVTNFLGYVNADSYDGSVIHRSTDKNNPSERFGVIQGGGFKYSDATQSVTPITPGSQIQNEFARLNSRGTIAMARTVGLHTATNQWFINTSDNSSIFGASNPYAVFGWVVGGGMSTVDHINNLTAGGMLQRDLSGPDYFNNSNFARTPVSQSYTDANYNALLKPTGAQLAMLQSVSVVSVHPDFQNPINVADIDNNNQLQALDALFIINDLLAHGNQQHAVETPFVGNAYLDPSGNNIVGALDALLVINALIEQSNSDLLAQSLGADNDVSLTLGADSSGSGLGTTSVMHFPTSSALVPEPSSFVLGVVALAALAGAALARRRRA